MLNSGPYAVLNGGRLNLAMQVPAPHSITSQSERVGWVFESFPEVLMRLLVEKTLREEVPVITKLWSERGVSAP